MTRPVSGGPARQVAKRITRAATDRGWFGRTPLDTHVVVCGWPRSGSTLLELMVHLCVSDVWTWPEEVPALRAATDAHRNHRFVCTKDPRDIGRVQAIRDHYRARVGRTVFLVTCRDPRAVLTSVHRGYGPSRGYYCEVERWRAVWHLVRGLRDDPDVVLVRHEDLVAEPDRVEAELSEAIGWHVHTPFRDFHELAEPARLDTMTRGALGGLRPLDPTTVDRWRDPQHHDRLRECRARIPELPTALADLGYVGERDAHRGDAWWTTGPAPG